MILQSFSAFLCIFVHIVLKTRPESVILYSSYKNTQTHAGGGLPPAVKQEVISMSELMNIIKSRRSTRAFKPELPPVEQIRRIVEAAEWAPSGMGRYNWHFSVVYNPEKTLKLARAIAEADNRGPEYNFYGAPVIINISCERDDRARPRLLLDQSGARPVRRTGCPRPADRVRHARGPHRNLLRRHRLHRKGDPAARAQGRRLQHRQVKTGRKEGIFHDF